MIRCTVCTNPRASFINSRLAQGRSLLSIVNEVGGMSYPALRRH